MNADSFNLYLTRLETIREGLTEPNKIKFIDDIFEALKYKDAIIEENHYKYHSSITKEIQAHQDTKLKLEGCALRWGIPGWEIENWLRMKPDSVIPEVKFWQEFNDVKQEPLVKPRIAKKPIGIPAGYKIKTQFSLKEVINNMPNKDNL
jgi:hypothetical protein